MNQDESIIISRDKLPEPLGNWLPELSSGPTPHELTTFVNEGLRTLRELMQLTEVRNATRSFTNDFGKALEDINNVTYYKRLHDILHRLKPDCVDPINFQIKRFPEDDLAVDIVNNHEADLNEIIDEIRKAVRNNSYTGSTGLIQSLFNTRTVLREAIKELNKEKLIRVIKRLDRILKIYHPDINHRLNSAARALPLEALAEAMELLHDKLIHLRTFAQTGW